jgi:hypothetical protein
MVKEKNSAANSVKAGDVKIFDTPPVPWLTPELIAGAHQVFSYQPVRACRAPWPVNWMLMS